MSEPHVCQECHTPVTFNHQESRWEHEDRGMDDRHLVVPQLEVEVERDVTVNLRCITCAEPVLRVTTPDGDKVFHHNYEAIGAKLALMRPEHVKDPLILTAALVCDNMSMKSASFGTYDGKGREKFTPEKRYRAFKAVNEAMLIYYFDDIRAAPGRNWLDARKAVMYGN